MSEPVNRTFSLADLVPEPLTFRDDLFGGDGTAYDVKTREMLGAIDIARLERLQGRIQEQTKASALLADREGVAQDLETAVDEICALLVVGLPAGRLTKIPFGFKLTFLSWWRAAQPEEPPLPGGAKAAPGPRRRSSRT